jgi:hypothetical protein
MPKVNQKDRASYETPQTTPNQLSTPMFGGAAPSKDDVIRSAHARGGMRHEMKSSDVADVDVIPDSAEMLGNEMVGVRNNGYLVKKGLEFGVNAFYNTLGPGMDIEDQENADIRAMDMVVYEGGISFPGDGWTHRSLGGQMPRTKDMGRPAMTNKNGSAKS